MKKMMKRIKNEKGLTLVELLAVVVILAIVAAIAFVMIGNVMENAKKDAAVADALQVINAAKLYEVTGTPVEGEDTDTTFSVTVETLQEGDGYLDTLYDPWTKKEYGTEEGIKVTKEADEYKLTGLNAKKCKIDHTEKELIKKGRDVCDETSTP